MKGLNYIIKNTTNATFFSLLSGGVFVSELDNAQRFTSEADAMLCMEEHIDGTDGFNKFGFDVECFIAPLIETGMLVKYKNADPDNFTYCIHSAEDQDSIFIQAIDSTETMNPPIVGVNSLDLIVISTEEEKAATARAFREQVAEELINSFGFRNPVGTDSLSTCIEEGYLMTEEQTDINEYSEFRFFSFMPSYMLKENGKTKPELMADTTRTLTDLIETYKRYKKEIDSFIGSSHPTKVSGYKYTSDVLSLADSINPYCGL